MDIHVCTLQLLDTFSRSVMLLNKKDLNLETFVLCEMRYNILRANLLHAISVNVRHNWFTIIQHKHASCAHFQLIQVPCVRMIKSTILS